LVSDGDLTVLAMNALRQRVVRVDPRIRKRLSSRPRHRIPEGVSSKPLHLFGLDAGVAALVTVIQTD
jgi:hypothetical protein